jgi:hypothetical protein
LTAAPGLVIGLLELLHSGEANELRQEANKLRDQANELRQEANRQRKRANEALGRIADHTQKVPTKAERNAEKLRPYLGAKIQVVNADDSRWGDGTEIAEIKDGVLTLFTPCGWSSSSASANYVHCEDLEIVEAPVGSVRLTIKVLKRYGTPSNLGQSRHGKSLCNRQPVRFFPKGRMYSAPSTSNRAPQKGEGCMFMNPLTVKTCSCW